MYDIKYWADENRRQPVVDYIESLKWSEQRKFLAGVERIKQDGPNLKRPTADYLGGKLGLWELRVFKYRILYTFIGKTAWFLHAFLKKTSEIPQQEINTALRRKEGIEK